MLKKHTSISQLNVKAYPQTKTFFTDLNKFEQA